MLRIALLFAFVASQPAIAQQQQPVEKYAIPVSTRANDEATSMVAQLRRDPRCWNSGKSELVPVLPSLPNSPPTTQRPPADKPTSPSDPTDDCCKSILRKLQEIEIKLTQLRATAELDQASVDAIADAVATKLQPPSLDGLATTEQLSQLESRLLEALSAAASPVGDTSEHRELALQIQRNTQALTSLTSQLELLDKSQQGTADKVKEVQLSVQRQAGSLQSLHSAIALLRSDVNEGGKDIDEVSARLNNIQLQLQRQTDMLPSSSQRSEEIATALSEVFGGAIKLRLRIDPATGEITGADPVP